MNKISLYAIILGLIICGAVWFFIDRSNNKKFDINQYNQTVEQKEDKINNQVKNNQKEKIMQATLHTNLGDITLELDYQNTPKTAENFVKLAQSGFYNNTKFHRVIKDFMNQGGDPLSKDDSKIDFWGTGGPGYTFEDEIGSQNNNSVGTISMANAGPNTNGSQFFINVKDNDFLNAKHTVFGKVISGMDVVIKINTSKTDENDRPISPIIIKDITLK